MTGAFIARATPLVARYFAKRRAMHLVVPRRDLISRIQTPHIFVTEPCSPPQNKCQVFADHGIFEAFDIFPNTAITRFILIKLFSHSSMNVGVVTSDCDWRARSCIS